MDMNHKQILINLICCSTLEGEELRHVLTAKRQKHYETLVKAAEESVARRLREKEAEVEKASRRKAELEARAAQLTVEAQILQAKVKAQDATTASLQAQLHHAIMMSHEKSVVVEDAESAYVDPDRVTVSGPKCRGCDIRVASVVKFFNQGTFKNGIGKN
ncbi:unnamed protein product [Lupinus luteus]|uniref:GAGA-binding transcriptional activator n=1 Tax=Lupinus luteus TaxID=3873 RepID=A0AAV1WY44_LUPLU